MKYLISNDLSNLSFHDSTVENVAFGGGNMIWSAADIYFGDNIGGLSKVKFLGYDIVSALYSGYSEFPDGWENYTEDRKNEVIHHPPVEMTEQEIDTLFSSLSSRDTGNFIQSLGGKRKDGKMVIDIDMCLWGKIEGLKSNTVYLTISCDSFTVEWEPQDNNTGVRK